MAEQKICGIYRISSPSGGFYIGSSFDVLSRFSSHKSDLRKQKHHCQPLQRAANKYGIESLVFEVLAECSRETVRELEQLVIDDLDPRYNSSRCTREALSDLWRQPAFRERGRARASEQIRRLRKDPAFKARQRDGAAKALARLHREPQFAQAHRERATERIQAMVNSNPSMKEKAANARRARMDRDKSDPVKWAERNRKIRELLERPVLCVETGAIYPSQKAAGEWLRSLGFKTWRHISNCIAGRVPTAYGYTWRHAEVDHGR
jgi:group I intron endonuclease